MKEKTKVDFRKMSNQFCACGCGRQLKLNLVNRKPLSTLLFAFPCFRAFEAARGHFMSTAREVRTNVKPGKKQKPVYTKEEWIARGRRY